MVDANLLAYAHVTSCPQHDGARQWLEEQLAGSSRVGLSWASALAVEHGLKLATSDRGFARFERLAWFDPLSPA